MEVVVRRLSMNLTEKRKKENEKFIKQWHLKRKAGSFNYFLKGAISSVVFLTSIYFIGNLAQGNKSFNVNIIISIVIVSLLAPLSSWMVNELRYNTIIK